MRALAVLSRDPGPGVTAADAGVAGFAPGDRVTGVNTRLELGPGPAAEYLTVPASARSRTAGTSS